MKIPKVTVLMPVYNGEKYLKDAIESILNQDFIDFEFLIFNDGSTDGSEKIILSFSDSRIKLINNEKNIGLVNTLNKGLDSSLGEYIVRMDCDDVSLKNRLMVQVEFMDKHTNIGASGCYYNLLLKGRKAIVDFPLIQDELKSFMLFSCPIAHPTAIIRRSVVVKEKLRYRPEYVHAEDYDFWSQLSEFSQIANISEVLLNYRIHENQITGNVLFETEKRKSLSAIRSRQLKGLNIEPSAEELLLHHLISDGSKPENVEQLVKSESWLKRLMIENQKLKKLNNHYFEKIILERWLRMCFNYYGGRKGFFYFMNSELYGLIKLPFKQKFELFKNLYYSYKRKSIKK